MNLNEIIELVSSVLKKYKEQIIFGYLFGSNVRGDLSPLSDIDIAVYLKNGAKETYRDAKLQLYGDFCRALKRNDIDVVIINTSTNLMLLDEIIRDGMVLLDNDINSREAFEEKILHRAIDFKSQRLANIGDAFPICKNTIS